MWLSVFNYLIYAYSSLFVCSLFTCSYLFLVINSDQEEFMRFAEVDKKSVVNFNLLWSGFLSLGLSSFQRAIYNTDISQQSIKFNGDGGTIS